MMTLFFLAVIFIVGWLLGAIYGYRSGYDEAIKKLKKNR